MSLSTGSFSRRQILTNVGALFSGTALARLLSAAVIAITARQVGIATFGEYATVLALLRIASIAFSLGLDGWLLRNGGRISGTVEDAVENATGNALATSSAICLVIKVGLGAAWLGVICLLVPAWAPALLPRAIVVPVALTLFFDELANVAWSIFKVSLNNRATMQLLTLMHGLALAGVALLWWVDATALMPYLLVRLIATAAGALIALFVAQRMLALQQTWVQLVALLPTVLRESVPFALSMFLALVYARADIAIVGQQLGREAAGLYAPASTVASALFLIPAAIYGVVLPVLSRTHSQSASSDAIAGVLKLARQATVGSAALGVVLAISVALLAAPIVRVAFGAEFLIGNTSTATILAILSGVLLLRCVSYALAALVVSVGWQGRRVVVQALTAGFNVVANLLLARRVGIEGVAVIYVVTELILMLGYALLARQWQQRAVRTVEPTGGVHA